MRVKTGIVRRKKHKKVLKLTKGYRMSKRKLYKVAHEAVLHAGQYAYVGRKLRKRDFRRLWIQRIGAALTDTAMTYSRFMNQLKIHNVKLNRKILAELAVTDPQTFKFILGQVAWKKNSKI